MSDDAKKSARAHVLIVEDSSVFREMQGLLLRQAGYAVSAHEHPEAALAAAKERAYNLVIIDYDLPGMNGQQFMHELRKILPDIAVVFVSGSLTLELAIQLSREGVAGIFNKPVNPKTLLEKINETLSRTGSRDAALPGRGSNAPLPAARRGNSNSPFSTATTGAASEPAAGAPAYAPRYFFGRSEPFRELTHRLWKVRDFRAVLLLQGEPGSPFELLARDLTEISIFRDGPVMVCDAAQFEARRLIEVLAPSLLSHDAGTLVITGVETFTTAQQKILENLMTGRDVFLPFARRFRLVLAAAANLSDLVDAGCFNETLSYKISSLSITVPALREMRSDILANARHLFNQHREAANDSTPITLTDAAAGWLEAQDWPGNYEQLSHTLVAAMRGNAGSDLDVPGLEAGLRDAPKILNQRKLAPASAPATENASLAHTGETRPPFPMKTDLAAEAAPATNGAPVLTARSVFHPVSSAYDFSKRLAASLAAAEAAVAA
jgi:DNA-binding NtrC family response regulator